MSQAIASALAPRPDALELVEGMNLRGRNVLITGGASGIGTEAVRALASAGARIHMPGRNPEAGRQVAQSLRETTGNTDIHGDDQLDLASLKSVRDYTDRFLATGEPVHILIDNAGVMACPFGRTADGFETQFGTNHLGHFALTLRLLPALRQAGSARVVVVSSSAHQRSDIHFDDPNYQNRPYDPWEAYGQSKTANVLFAVALNRRLSGEGITANALMPGGIPTNLARHLAPGGSDAPWLNEDGSVKEEYRGFFKTAEQGAATTVWAAVGAELEGVGGQYLEDCAVAPVLNPADAGEAGMSGVMPWAIDPDNAERLWHLSEELTDTRFT